jgi:hypothetical protein
LAISGLNNNNAAANENYNNFYKRGKEELNIYSTVNKLVG